MINSAKKLQSDEFSTSTTDSNILDQTPLLSQKMKSGNESEFSAKNRMWESMKSLSQNFSITGSQHLSRTSETTNIAKDEQQSQPFITMESLTAIEDSMIEKENSSLISLSTFSISSRLQKHDDHCRRQHRRKMWHTRSKLKKSDDKRNEENFLELLDEYKFFNCNICSYDYSGYGISDGNPSEKNMYSDITAVYKYLLEDLSIPEANIILWGYSIGTVASIELAKQANKLAGLILLAPIASIIRTICWGKCCWRRNKQCDHLANCCGDRFNSFKKISEIEMPTLIAHGVQDMIVTVEHGKALYQLCPGAVKPLWIPDVGHNNLENSSMLWRRMRKFIDREARPPLQRTKCKSLKKDIQNSIDLLNDCNHKCERKNLLV
ncbi:unnamed protein product [Brugia pahangi]|uniref:Hydrolase_4 domain-containing protein n=1 Tax=Brugia pahangi TaxID=6280 RepID=A0A0N4TYR8_BRUPA|nr:unnamed protein product [Brugia pahangi]